MAENPYDSVPYRSRALHQAHPDRLAVLARLFGMSPCPIEQSRILELGCGDGSNLIPVAYGLPQAEVVGIDSSADAIARGHAAIEGIAVENATLHCMDIEEVDESFGLFDYIIAHGVLSWVAEDLQEKLLSICERNLAAQGIAYVSYNTYPGWHLRGMVREILQFHTDHFPDPAEKAAQAKAFLQFIVEAAPTPSPEGYHHVLRNELDRLVHVQDHYIYHGQLADINRPLYFHEFIHAAGQQGLKYLAEADFFEMQDHFFSPKARETLRAIAGQNLIAKEQLMDFMKGRKFRQTLLCHRDVALDRALHPQRLRDLYCSCPSRPVDSRGEEVAGNIIDLMARDDLLFHRRRGSSMDTDHPIALAALLHLSRAYPTRLCFQEVLELAQTECKQMSSPVCGSTERDSLVLANVLLTAYAANIAELHVHAPKCASVPGRLPVASPVARWQTRTEAKVTNLFHRMVDLGGTYAQRVLPLLDGSRDHQTIRNEAIALIRNDPLSADDPTGCEKSDEELGAEIGAELADYGRYGLLIE